MQNFISASLYCSLQHDERTFAKGSYVLTLKHLLLCVWQLVCGKSDFGNVSPLFLNCPTFLVEIPENIPGFLKGNMGTNK
jgi:hypothetical protein